jgi:hypothetical protein
VVGRSNRRRSARWTLLVAALATLSALAGLSAAVETVKPEWRDPEFGHRLKRLRTAEAAGRPLVLVLGTSRTQNAIHPAVMGFADQPDSPRVFNFGQSASSPLKVLLTLLRVMDAEVRPAAVVVEVLPVWLATNGTADELFAHQADRLSARDLRHLAPYCSTPAVLWRNWRAARLAPWSAHRFVLLSHWLPRWVPWTARIDFQWDTMDADGYTPFPHANPSDEVRATATEHARNEYRHSFGGFRPAATAVQALRDLVGRCQQEGIPVAFVVPPVSPGFRGWFTPHAWVSGETAVNQLARDLDVPVFWPTDYTDTDFVDGHHMLPATADRYSRWLADVHLRPWLTSKGVLP